MTLTADEIERFIDMALAEDIGPGDITTEAVVPEAARLTAEMRARQPLVVAGIDIAAAVFRRRAPDCTVTVLHGDGSGAETGAVLARIAGPARGLLTAERTALNIVQHLSGIATFTRAYVDRLAGTGTILLDTRKTIPGLRRLAKYAAHMGGACNHRMGLFDAVLIKDNHIAVRGTVSGTVSGAARGAVSGAIAAAVAAARACGRAPIEVECDTLDQLAEALEAGAERVLLDNMDLATLRRAVAMAHGRAVTEASGGVTLETVRRIAETGVDFVSVGRITQSAPAVDIGLDYSGGGADGR